MAKRELSSTLRNLKFMQRATQRDEMVKKEEEEVKPDGGFSSAATQLRKCVVVMEGDPSPGAIKGRISFNGFNPLIDKLNNPGQPAASASSSGIHSERVSTRESGSSMDEAECSNIDNSNCEPNGDHKRKQSEVLSETQYPNKSPKNDQGQSSSNKSKGSFKKPKGGKLDYNILRPSKSQTKKGRP
ncbi:putative M-phase phosphoprotein [Rosa chinensis]|uniref:Putative M-phase phosphoprotein n=1 Tax=Rosa chinensis TaxID=74649 RepID=A0A2P6QIZ1_ROSCH|nr:uncharacterized protein LOC112202457 [Rosa chinensis]PRQ34157.1 putative M-phase phosphoprotein [Rosa chinensis]